MENQKCNILLEDPSKINTKILKQYEDSTKAIKIIKQY